MDSKMLKTQEHSKQLQDEELESIAGERLDDLVKNRSLRGKVARWAAVAASVVGISVGMAMPAKAINRVQPPCLTGFLNIWQGHKHLPDICFANAGFSGTILIHDVIILEAGNNAGQVFTNRGTYQFQKWEGVNFLFNGGPVTIFGILVY